MTTTTRITVEIELEVEGTFVPYERETGPTYDCGGTPAVEAHFEDLDITAAIIDGKAHTIRVWAAPWNDILEANRPAIIEALLEAHTS